MRLHPLVVRAKALDVAQVQEAQAAAPAAVNGGQEAMDLIGPGTPLPSRAGREIDPRPDQT